MLKDLFGPFCTIGYNGLGGRREEGAQHSARLTFDKSIGVFKRFGISLHFQDQPQRRGHSSVIRSGIYCPLPAHLYPQTPRHPAGTLICRGKHSNRSHSFPPQSKIINATDNCIEELGLQCLQPSIEGQLSQT